jgi:hypothetical protein
MQGGNLERLLGETLQPATTRDSYLALATLNSTPGFTTQLLLISSDGHCDIAVRQSALVYLKNLIAEHCAQGDLIPRDDLETLKNSLLEGTSLPIQPSSAT